MNKIIISVCLILSLTVMINTTYSQAPSRVNIEGTLIDSSNNTIPFATIMLLSVKDSTLVSFTTSNENGEFKLNNIKNETQILKISHVSYIPHQQNILPTNEKTLILKGIELKPIQTDLLEVVVRAAKAPLFIKGDTVEFDATTFIVPPGSTVEDLLSRLPGVEVDSDGKITTQGQEVKKVYVEGKTFFGNDPKSVTKNLGAESVSRVQIYDEKSEQSQLTGIDDGTQEKAMNLELKEAYKTGAFGKLSVAGGTQDRWAVRGNYNRFTTKSQLSFIGYGNNINQTGLNWSDYSEFKGNNAFTEYDNGDFGFIASVGDYNFFRISGVSRFDGKGFTDNYGGGTNYNYDNSKTKFNTSYLYNQTDLYYVKNSYRETILDSLSGFNKYDTLNYNNKVFNHSIGTRFEHNFDSANKIIAKVNVNFSGDDDNNSQNQWFTDLNLEPSNHLQLSSIKEIDKYAITSAAIYNHKFKKLGRSFSLSGGFNTQNSENNTSLKNLNELFNALTPNELIQQYAKTDNSVTEIKSSLLYTEPLSSKFFFEFFSNFSNNITQNNNQVHDVVLDSARIDSLSNLYKQTTLFNRVGSSIRYSYDGLNIAVGFAAERIGMDGLNALDKGFDWNPDKLNKVYYNFAPNVMLNYMMSQNNMFGVNYSKTISPPSYAYLQPIKNTSNPAYQYLGNINLLPSTYHSVDLNLRLFNPSSFSSINMHAGYSLTQNPIYYALNTTFVPGKGVITVAKPTNMDNEHSVYSYVWTSFPIIKTKLTTDFMVGYSYRKQPSEINKVRDWNDANTGRTRLRFNLTPSQHFNFSFTTRFNYSTNNYQINKTLNNNFYTLRLNADIKWQFINKTYFESSFDYYYYYNSKIQAANPIPLWHASIRRLLGKGNKFEVRLAAFDIFNKSLSIDQIANLNYIEQATTNTLARYFMLSVSYNLKGFDQNYQRRGGGGMRRRH
ncbi:MAG: outer membrane beta-barrel protein [Bacteroidales bacterium]